MVFMLLLCFIKASDIVVEVFPDTSKILKIAYIANSAYYDHEFSNLEYSFIVKQGLSGKVYKFDKNVIIAFKGTSLSLYGWNWSKTSENDKINDTLMFTCCNTSKGIIPWQSSENCFNGIECNEECVLALLKEYGYVYQAETIVREALKKYKGYNIILTGHSMGGAIASLMGAKYDILTYAFSSPGERHIANRIGIPNGNKIYHFGICSDIIFRGKCNKKYSLCSIGGYNIETRCHLGNVICFNDGSSESILKHRMRYFIDVLSNNKIRDIEIINEVNCNDCIEFDY
ncbi:putative lipase ATG15 [Astathelohania contejeani]|uniref:triacylglycerol lipase n=1 Tax=Astathelohania contejeani TaxID=164912 RepID=A0ABQ7HVX2_9MICR|nr:putative lipase ATG15 [Thelohania contejeani]